VVTRAPSGVMMRRGTPADVEALVSLVNEAYRKTEGHVFPGSTRTERGDLLERIGEIIVAEADGRPVGCLHFTTDGDVAHFGLLAADVRLHGRGIGSALIAHAEHLGRDAGCRVMRIESVKEANMLPYYERRGYRVLREKVGQEWNGGQDWGAAIEWHMVELEKILEP
jgi:GNAT superfamily N-acetyltransferase